MLITYFEVAAPVDFLPASKNLFESDKTKLYFGHNRDRPDLTREIVVLICPILGGMGFVNNSLSSSGLVNFDVNLSTKAANYSDWSKLNGA